MSEASAIDDLLKLDNPNQLMSNWRSSSESSELLDPSLLNPNGRDPSGAYDACAISGNGVSIIGGFAALITNPEALSQGTLDNMEEYIDKIKKGSVSQIPSSYLQFGEVLDISSLQASNPKAYLMVYLGANFRTDCPAIISRYKDEKGSK